MKGYVINSNALLRYLKGDVPIQTEKVRKIFVLAKSRDANVIIPSAVFIETVYVLEKYYNYPRQDIYNSLIKLLKTSYITIPENSVFIPAFNLYLRANISITDAYLISLSRLQELSLFTFDKKLQKISKSS